MKKEIFTLAKKRIFPLLVFVFVQAKSWALDSASPGTVNKSTSIFTEPWIGIAIIVIVTVTIVLVGPLDREKEYPVKMKKRQLTKKNKQY